MNDKREPAFARRLLRRRWSGATLHRVAVIFGGAWSLPQGGKIAAATVSEFVAISSRRSSPESECARRSSSARRSAARIVGATMSQTGAGRRRSNSSATKGTAAGQTPVRRQRGGWTGMGGGAGNPA